MSIMEKHSLVLTASRESRWLAYYELLISGAIGRAGTGAAIVNPCAARTYIPYMCL
jgi:hypothetical protein